MLEENEEKLYCLVNNAGGIINERKKNSQGYEVHTQFIVIFVFDSFSEKMLNLMGTRISYI